jgi:hypothetical protein
MIDNGKIERIVNRKPLYEGMVGLTFYLIRALARERGLNLVCQL